MINIKNIVEIILMALFICVYSYNAAAAGCPKGYMWDANSHNCIDYVTTKGYCPSGQNFDMSTGKCYSISGGGQTITTHSNPTMYSNQENDASFCEGGLGVFSDLVKAGQKIFNRLRDLIYVVAGFGIIGVAVGGFFGNLNWKWLGAIVISLVVIASAGELIVLITGCKQYGTTLITDTLSSPAKTGKTVPASSK